MTEPIIAIENLDFSYGDTSVLEKLSLSVYLGDFVGIFGPNGGGKTTLLKLIMGFLTPKRGVISVMGQSPKAVRTQIGYVPQHLHFDRDFPVSVLDVVLLGCLSHLTWWGGYPSGAKAQALRALEIVGMTHKATSHFGTLSGGETQRVLIARAIVDRPQLLLLDEPTASVDPQAEQGIYQLLFELKATMTILMVTHDLQAILDNVNRYICVHRRATVFANKELCEHFALGLYHTPLTPKAHFPA